MTDHSAPTSPPSAEPFVAAGFAVRAPWDGQLLGHVGTAGPQAVDAACRRAALLLGTWPVAERIRCLESAAVSLESESSLFASAITQEVGKPIRYAEAEVQRAIETLRWSAHAARSITAPRGVAAAATAGHAAVRAWVERRPVGVVAAITPFNFPLNLLLHKLGPAMAAGCPVVAKPAPQGVLVALRLLELLRRCGMPEDFVQMLADQDGVAARALVVHPQVALVSFTGSAIVGRLIREAAWDRRVELELGSQSPVIVDADTNPAEWAPRIAEAACGFAGQSCIAVQRVLVPAARARQWEAALAAAADDLVSGDPGDPATVVGPPIRTQELTRWSDWLAEAVAGGARLLCGGRSADRVFLPTFVADVPGEARLRTSEVFGPIATVETWRTHDEAIRLANASPQRIHVGVITNDLAFARQAVADLDFGGVLIGEVPTRRLDQQPYGGIGAAGEAREGPESAVLAMTREVFVSWG